MRPQAIAACFWLSSMISVAGANDCGKYFDDFQARLEVVNKQMEYFGELPEACTPQLAFSAVAVRDAMDGIIKMYETNRDCRLVSAGVAIAHLKAAMGYPDRVVRECPLTPAATESTTLAPAPSTAVTTPPAAPVSVKAAVRIFDATAASPSKLKEFCALEKFMDVLRGGDADLDAIATESDQLVIDAHMKELGSDFKAAWDLSGSLDSLPEPESNAYLDAYQRLLFKCPGQSKKFD
jgi:hypothetical protein